MVCGPVDSPACGTERRPSARAAAKYGVTGAGAPIRATQAEADQPVRALIQRHPQGLFAGTGTFGLPGNVEAPAQLDAQLGRAAAGVLDSVAELLGRDTTDHVRVRGDGQLGVSDLLLGQVAGDLVGEQPDVLGVADQIDHAEVDLDEVAEVAELEVPGQQLRVRRDRAGALVSGGECGHRPRGG